jgi:hypothetical protein
MMNEGNGLYMYVSSFNDESDTFGEVKNDVVGNVWEDIVVVVWLWLVVVV